MMQRIMMWIGKSLAKSFVIRFVFWIMSLIRHLIILKKMNESKDERRVGLGTMGLAELMIKLEIRYGSPESLVFLG